MVVGVKENQQDKRNKVSMHWPKLSLATSLPINGVSGVQVPEREKCTQFLGFEEWPYK